MAQLLLSILQAANQVLAAGNTITAFSLLLYALTFNLRVRVARTFAQLLGCLTLVFFGDVMASTAMSPQEIGLWLRLQWIGISLVPPTYFHVSDALLEATGRPSRGRRHLAIRLTYVAAAGLILLAGLSDAIAGPLVAADMAAYLEAGPWFFVYAAFFLACIGFAGFNFKRAYERCLTRASRRRMRYFMAGAVAPLVSSFPLLEIGHGLVLRYPILFLASVALLNSLVAGLLVLMAYAVAYFGVSYPDRVVKSRLFQWILRGPVVASSVLAVTVFVGRLGNLVGLENTRAAPFFMIGSLLFLQLVITLIRPGIERWLFYGGDREEIRRLHLLEERLLTTGDLRQFLESILNAVCDVTRSKASFAAVVGAEGLELEVAVGAQDPLRNAKELPPIPLDEQKHEAGPLGAIFVWDSYWLIPIHGPDNSEVVGILGILARASSPDLTDEEAAAVKALADRASVALTNRRLQKDVFQVVDRLVPKVEEIQRLRVAASFGGAAALTAPVDELGTDADLAGMVREALGHYWGGPRLTSSPLMGLRIVRDAMKEHEGNPVNALRGILRRGIERVRPPGERRFTGEWMLYNILEMKFVEGRKVRDVAIRLAMSEADLYRKQRVAIEAVARAIADMEREAHARADEKQQVL